MNYFHATIESNIIVSFFCLILPLQQDSFFQEVVDGNLPVLFLVTRCMAFSRWFIGLQQVVYWSSAGGLLVFSRWFIGLQQVVYWSSAGGLLVFSRWFIGLQQVVYWSSAGGLLVFSRWFIGLQQVVYWSSAGGLPTL